LLSSLLEQLAIEDQHLAGLEREYGPNHAEVVKCKAMADDLHRKIKTRVEGILLGLDARVASLKRGLDNFEKEVAQAKTNDVAEASRTRPYFEAKRNLEDLQHFRQVLDLKIASEKIDVDLPNRRPVEVLDQAVPPLRPISPNLPRALAVIVFGILLDLAGLLMLNGLPRLASTPRPA
jgi:uncharacterized protein involved in exopolysaccharide biosynthesis